MKSYIRTLSLEDVLFYLILIPQKLVNYLRIRGTMGLILRTFEISMLLKYAHA